MIIVCERCVKGNETADTTIREYQDEQLDKPRDGEDFECFHCNIEVGIDDPAYLLDNLSLPQEFVEDITVQYCSNDQIADSSDLGTIWAMGYVMELHEYVASELEEREFEKYYPTLWAIFTDTPLEFDVPDIICERCGIPAAQDWEDSVGISKEYDVPGIAVPKESVDILKKVQNLTSIDKIFYTRSDLST